ncbi:hypothetical protein AB0H42_27525 [Nocardia sp. NPDC050799]|uniref:DUF7064 domain-containing protein n=1 Tax=Nocardia sp. NPDC050799 TaxID=3154842 RepID=UPI0033DB6980
MIHRLERGAERRHIFYDPESHPDVRESLAYLLPLPELGLGVIFYTWVHALGPDGLARAGAAGIVYGPGVAETVFEVTDGIGVPDSLSFDDWRVGPATMTLTDDMMDSRITFAGERVRLDLDWAGSNPAFGYRANRNGCPEWLAADRTEQGARVTGTLHIDGTDHRVDGFGHRDHSWGMRDWGGATHWKWWNVMADGGTAIHVMELQYFGRTTLHGYVQKDGIIATATGLDAEMTFDERFVHTAVTATVTDESGRVTEITCRRGADLQWPVSPRLWLHEASMHATVDGRPAVAYLECAWPPEYIAHHRTDGVRPGGRNELTLDRD